MTGIAKFINIREDFSNWRGRGDERLTRNVRENRRTGKLGDRADDEGTSLTGPLPGE